MAFSIDEAMVPTVGLELLAWFAQGGQIVTKGTLTLPTIQTWEYQSLFSMSPELWP